MTKFKYGMKRPFGMGTFPKNDSVIGTDPENKKEDTGFYDILWTSEPLTEKEIYDFELTPLDMDSVLKGIAHKILDLETLDARNSDSLDFHDMSVWGIKEALEAAYKAGMQNGKA